MPGGATAERCDDLQRSHLDEAVVPQQVWGRVVGRLQKLDQVWSVPVRDERRLCLNVLSLTQVDARDLEKHRLRQNVLGKCRELVPLAVAVRGGARAHVLGKRAQHRRKVKRQPQMRVLLDGGALLVAILRLEEIGHGGAAAVDERVGEMAMSCRRVALEQLVPRLDRERVERAGTGRGVAFVHRAHALTDVLVDKDIHAQRRRRGVIRSRDAFCGLGGADRFNFACRREKDSWVVFLCLAHARQRILHRVEDTGNRPTLALGRLVVNRNDITVHHRPLIRSVRPRLAGLQRRAEQLLCV